MGVDENLVGMEQRMQDLDPYLEIDLDDVRMVGIKGMRGARKTTLARAIFDKLSIYFEGKSFVEDVRENSKASLLGMKKLQEQVLRDVLRDKGITVSSVHEGTNLMKTMLCGKKVLIVLDDADHREQLEALAGYTNWFKLGSRIIITTRDEQVLIAHRVKWIRDVNLLSNEEAIHLFRKHAFREDILTEEYDVQSLEVIHYAAGLPLTIKVLGSFLCGKSKPECIEALARLKTIPLQETLTKLELSYENLEDDYKKLFLDVACFYRHLRMSWPMSNKVITMLESCGFKARNGLRVLHQKCLITIDKEWNLIHMHDHIEEMGKNIARHEHRNEPTKHSRLWVQEEIEYVLANDLGTEATRCIELEITPGIVLESLRNMKKLECLIVHDREVEKNISDDCVKINEAREYFPNSLRYLYWNKYHHRCLPKTFEANNLVALEMDGGKIKQLWEGGKIMKRLKFLDLSNSKELRSLDLGLTPNLERLNLKGCIKLVTVDVHGGCLKNLVYLNLNWCRGLKSISFIEQLESLEFLHMRGLNLKEFPNYITTGHSSNILLELNLSGNIEIEEVPSSIGTLHKLVSLYLQWCSKLKSVPGSICSLQHLTTLNLECSRIEELPEDLGQLECLEHLLLSGTKVKHLPGSICMLKHLKNLLLPLCHLLEKLPEDVGQLESLEILHLTDFPNLREIPNTICKLKCLKELDLGGCERLEKLPEKLGSLKCLQLLSVWDTGITQSIDSLEGLEIEYIQEEALQRIENGSSSNCNTSLMFGLLVCWRPLLSFIFRVFY